MFFDFTTRLLDLRAHGFFLNSMIASLFVAWIIGIVALINVYSGGGRPTAIFVIYPFYLMVGTAGIRLLARRLLEVQIYPTEAKKVSVIYGCGSGGTQLFGTEVFISRLHLLMTTNLNKAKVCTGCGCMQRKNFHH